MKAILKSLILGAAALMCSMSAGAQDLNILNHLSVGANIGTTGIGVDVAMPLTRFVTIRPGFNWMSVKPTLDFDIDAPDMSDYPSYIGGQAIPSSVDMKGELKFTTFKLLFDVYPFLFSGFHVTAGAYFGGNGGDIVTLDNETPGVLKSITDWNQKVSSGQVPGGQRVGVELGDYLLTPDANGNVHANLQVKKFRPYVGIGFGRTIPGSLIGFNLDLGCQFWGNPAVYCNGEELKKDNVGDGDAGKIIKTISKISVYPVLNLRLCGKIF